MFKKLLSACLCLVLCFVSVSCRKQESDPIVTVSSRTEQAEICGFTPPDILLDGYAVSSYRTIYGIVAETEYTAEQDEKRAVLRMTDGGYNVNNLSGFTDMGLEDVYTYDDGREFEIETRDGVFAVEWESEYSGKKYKLSLTVFDGTLLDTRILLKQVLAAYNTEENT